MDRYKYMHPIFYIIPQEVINEYNFTDIAHNRKANIHIRKGIYGIPQSGIIAHDIYLKSTWRSMYINLLNSPQDYVPKNPVPYPSSSLLMTL